VNGVKLGNAVIDGEVVGNQWRQALEIKSGHDDVVRGLGQLLEALSHKYQTDAWTEPCSRRAAFANLEMDPLGT
jgi:hypothetical protein